MWSEPEILSAWIQGGCAVLSALVAALAASLIGKKFVDQGKLRADLNQAMEDIQFLLEVEKVHCEIHKDNTNQSYKNKVREEATQRTGLNWSGRFTPGRIRGNRRA